MPVTAPDSGRVVSWWSAVCTGREAPAVPVRGYLFWIQTKHKAGTMSQGDPHYTQWKLAEELLFGLAYPFWVKPFGEMHRTSAESGLGGVSVGTLSLSPHSWTCPLTQQALTKTGPDLRGPCLISLFSFLSLSGLFSHKCSDCWGQ